MTSLFVLMSCIIFIQNKCLYCVYVQSEMSFHATWKPNLQLGESFYCAANSIF